MCIFKSIFWLKMKSITIPQTPAVLSPIPRSSQIPGWVTLVYPSCIEWQWCMLQVQDQMSTVKPRGLICNLSLRSVPGQRISESIDVSERNGRRTKAQSNTLCSRSQKSSAHKWHFRVLAGHTPHVKRPRPHFTTRTQLHTSRITCEESGYWSQHSKII